MDVIAYEIEMLLLNGLVVRFVRVRIVPSPAWILRGFSLKIYIPRLGPFLESGIVWVEGGHLPILGRTDRLASDAVSYPLVKLCYP